jgi:hypothetical protein
LFLEGGMSVDDTVSDEELKKVIADFLEMGHVDNIFEMFKRDIRYYHWVGELLDDERFNVRLGISVLFEELKLHCEDDISLAVPSLCETFGKSQPHVRGEVISVLGIIGNDSAIQCIRKGLSDESPQVQEVAMDVLEELG